MKLGVFARTFAGSDIDTPLQSAAAAGFEVRLAPGCGQTLTLTMDRHVNRPVIAFPWSRRWR